MLHGAWGGDVGGRDPRAGGAAGAPHARPGGRHLEPGAGRGGATRAGGEAAVRGSAVVDSGAGGTVDRVMSVQVRRRLVVSAIAGGEYHSLALKGDGTVWAWEE